MLQTGPILLLWLIPFCPAAGAALLWLSRGRLFPARVWSAAAGLTTGVGLGLSIAAVIRLARMTPDQRAIEVALATWIPKIPLQTMNGIGFYEASWGLRMDALAGVACAVITAVGTAAPLAAAGRHRVDARDDVTLMASAMFACASSLLLVMASQYPSLFAGWVLAGLSATLASGRRSPRHTLFVGRVGDCALLIAVLLVYHVFGTLDLSAVSAAVSTVPAAASPGLTTIVVLLCVAATCKALEYPRFGFVAEMTPGPMSILQSVLAIVAVVYLLARSAMLFAHLPTLTVVMAAGALVVLTVAGAGRRRRLGSASR